MDFQKYILNLLKKHIPIKNIQLEIPPNPEFGDFSFPCFQLSKILKKPPQEIAQEIASKLSSSNIIIKPIGPYINFFIKRPIFIEQTIEQTIEQKSKYGSSNLGKGKKVLIEHTSINPNASPHIGRARNAIIGDSITRILKFQNYKVKTHYFVNDVGKQVALLVLACKKPVKFEELLSLYIKINRNLTPEIEKKALDLLNKFEKGDKKTIDKFEKIVNICLKGQIKILSQLGIKYDKFDFESSYLKKGKVEKALKDLEKTGKLFKDEFNRKILDQSEFFSSEMKSPLLVLTRANNTSLYPLRDIAYNLDKTKQASINIVVLGEDQKLYQKQISAALQLLKKTPPIIIHYSFVLLTQGQKMSTRKGNLVLLSDFLQEALKKSKEELKKRCRKSSAKISNSIANSAIKYNILKISPEKNVIFDLSTALSFEGDTGPYLQYTYARASSILKKAKISPKAGYSQLTSEEFEIIKKISYFQEIVLKASKLYKPHLIAIYLYELSKLFNEFYHKYPVIRAPLELKNARLNLVKATKQVLNNGLNLLGITPLEKM